MQNARATCKRFLSLPLRLAALTAAVRLFGRAWHRRGHNGSERQQRRWLQVWWRLRRYAGLLAEGGITAAEVMSWVASLGTITIAVTSSAIASVSYAPSLPDIPSVSDDGITGTVSVNFRDGSQVDYENISPLKFLDFVSAPSVGAFYNSEVRSNWG
jgi:KTSC domain